MFDIDECMSYLTNKTAKKIADSCNERLACLGTTRIQWIALFYLGKCEGISQKELGERMNITGSSVARLIDRMEKECYVTRVTDSTDRRLTNLYLTEKGKELREKLFLHMKRDTDILAQNISEEEKKIFITVLKKIEANIDTLNRLNLKELS